VIFLRYHLQKIFQKKIHTHSIPFLLKGSIKNSCFVHFLTLNQQSLKILTYKVLVIKDMRLTSIMQSARIYLMGYIWMNHKLFSKKNCPNHQIYEQVLIILTKNDWIPQFVLIILFDKPRSNLKEIILNISYIFTDKFLAEISLMSI